MSAESTRFSVGCQRLRLTRRQVFVVALFALLAACDSPPPPVDIYEVKVDVTEWIQALGSDDLFESEPAMDGLTALGPSVIPALEAAFEREDAAIRRGVIEVLQQLDSGDVMPLFLRAIEDPDEEVRIQALEAVALSRNERAGPIVERALNDPSRAIRGAAVDACAVACNSPTALRRIVDIALHDRPFMRIALPRQTLRHILRQDDTKRAQTAREAITSAALPLLDSAENREERFRAALLLADMNDPAAISPLHEMLLQPIEGVPRNVNAQMQIQAMAALGEIGNEGSVAVLRNRLKGVGPFRPGACRALDQLARRGVEGAAEEVQRCVSVHR